ncbi:hypothetical protein FRC02_009352 [Tulasnella sp. 418]|nr:hypothetical protein FRC02_009352 [Tulasnella sp. 418]
MKSSLMSSVLAGLTLLALPVACLPGGEIEPMTSGPGGVAISTTSAIKPSTWASTVIFGSNSRYTVSTTAGANDALYTTITTNGGWMRIPLSSTSVPTRAIKTAVATPVVSAPTSRGSNHLALAVALPVTLLVACAILVALLLYRRRAIQRERRRRANSWAARMPWVSDQKVPQGNDFEEPPTPLSPLAPTHQRKTSIA